MACQARSRGKTGVNRLCSCRPGRLLSLWPNLLETGRNNDDISYLQSQENKAASGLRPCPQKNRCLALHAFLDYSRHS